MFLSPYRDVIHNSKEVLSLLQEKNPAFKPVLVVIQVSCQRSTLLAFCLFVCFLFFVFFETGFLHVALAVLELTL